MDAINKIRNKGRLKRAALWSVRWRNINGEYKLANAKPCLFCRNLAMRCGIKSVFYSDDEGKIIKAQISKMECKLTSGSVINLRSNCGYKNVLFTRNNPNANCAE